MNRTEMLHRVREHEKIWDFVIIGGGATGIGCAVDAASRGFQVLLLEQNDFGKGTSSRSTKLVHGGVRYLAQGNVALVRESLRERGNLLRNAPHLIHKLPLVVPVYSYWDKFFYGAGLKTYNLLSGKSGFGKSELLSRDETIAALPNVKQKNLQGGIRYFDGQFDDTRLLIDLARTAAEHGAVVLNHARVFSLRRDESGRIDGAAVSDEITGQVFFARAKVVINAAGAFCDAVRRFSNKNAASLIAPSQGIHLVFDGKFLPNGTALMVPKTSDERVLFGIPWQGRAVFGTTDTPIDKAEPEPTAREEEIEFILKTAANYLETAPKRDDILSVFVGVRPLVRADNTENTASLSRDHTIEIDSSKLLTITGGKWTTYRKMAEDAIDRAIEIANLEKRKCVTENLRIHGFSDSATETTEFAEFGSDAAEFKAMISEDPSAGDFLHPDLPYRKAHLLFAIRFEMAKTPEDFLARRTRALFLNSKAAIEMAPLVAAVMARELNKELPELWIDEQIKSFSETARHFVVD